MSNVMFQICKFLHNHCFTVLNFICLHVCNLFHVDFDDNCGPRSQLLLDTSESDTSPLSFCIKTTVPYFSWHYNCKHGLRQALFVTQTEQWVIVPDLYL